MVDLRTFHEVPPFEPDSEAKDGLLTSALSALTAAHRSRCAPYRRILDCLQTDLDSITHYDQLPFIPVSLFKERELRSVPTEEVLKTMTSSGTSGQAVSKIVLDRETAKRQQRTLVRIGQDFLGPDRLPMLIIDRQPSRGEAVMSSARGAGIVGFSVFGADRTYALDENMKPDVEHIRAFLERHRDEKVLLFGFTFIVWRHFYQACVEIDESLDLSNAVLVHGGGWKKLVADSVSPRTFKHGLKKIFGLPSTVDYYGMIEQAGSISMECGEGHLHASVYSDVIARRAVDLQVCDFGEKGILQVLSVLPESYPGHSLLTEDERKNVRFIADAMAERRRSREHYRIVREHWTPFLDGKIDRDVALDRIVLELVR
jgi:hypothetical protein